jgi:hypothetical protein
MKSMHKGAKHVGRKAGMKKATKEANQHDRKTKEKGAKGFAKRLEGREL